MSLSVLCQKLCSNDKEIQYVVSVFVVGKAAVTRGGGAGRGVGRGGASGSGKTSVCVTIVPLRLKCSLKLNSMPFKI